MSQDGPSDALHGVIHQNAYVVFHRGYATVFQKDGRSSTYVPSAHMNWVEAPAVSPLPSAHLAAQQWVADQPAAEG